MWIQDYIELQNKPEPIQKKPPNPPPYPGHILLESGAVYPIGSFKIMPLKKSDRQYSKDSQYKILSNEMTFTISEEEYKKIIKILKPKKMKNVSLEEPQPTPTHPNLTIDITPR
jgi:hypothetical protein